MLTRLAGIALAAASLFTHAAPATGDGRDVFEAESANLFGGVVTASNQDVNRVIHWPVASINDGDTVSGKTYDELWGARYVATARIGSNTYALVTASWDNGVQIIDITDPASPAPVSSFDDGDTVSGKTFDMLGGTDEIVTTRIGSNTYALVVGWKADGVQIVDVTDPANPVPVASFDDGDTVGGKTYDELDGATGITTAKIGAGTYALVVADDDDGVQIVDITDPANPVPVASFDDGDIVGGKTYDELEGPGSITTARIGAGTYALVAASDDDGVQIIDITDPANPLPVASFDDGDTVGSGTYDELDDPRNITTAEIGSRTYALVASFGDNGVQIIDITDPASPLPVASFDEGDTAAGKTYRELKGAGSITTARIGSRTYAVVAAHYDNGVQIVDITDPASPVPVASFEDGDTVGNRTYENLQGPANIGTVRIGAGTYVLVTAYFDNGIQIIGLKGPLTVDAGQDQFVKEGETVTLSGTVSDPENERLAYEWTHDSSLAISLADDQALSTGLTAPAVTADTTVTFTLTVSDGTTSVSDTVSITIRDNRPPTVDAGQGQTVDEGEAVTLSGTAADPDDEALTYRWTHDSSLAISLADDTALSTAFTVPDVTADTTVIFTLAVSDGATSVSDTVAVTIANNEPPIVDAGPDRTVHEGWIVTLSGTASDPDDDPLTYRWTHDSSLAISVADGTARSTTFTVPAVTANTAVTFTLAASDGIATTSDTVTVTVSETPAGAAGQVRTLDSLTLSDVDIGEFVSDTTNYTGLAAARVARTTVTATPTDAAAAVTIADADGSTEGTTRMSSLAVGANEITVTVTSADGRSTRNYMVTVTRPAGLWGDRLPELDIALDAISRPTAIWGSDAALRVGAWGEYDVYAYDFEGGRVPDLDLSLASGGFPAGMWSDGTTLWVADHFSGVLAHSLADGSREPDKDFGDATASTGNDAANGVWSDGTTLWIADRVDSKIYAYGLSHKARAEDAEFSLLSVEGLKPSGLWSDGETVLTASWQQGRVYAFRLADGTPLPAKTIDTAASGNTKPFGLWSDGETLWVVDDGARKAFAYAVPGLSDSLAEVSIVADASPVSEGTPAAFTLRRSGDAAEALLVSVSVSESGEMTAADVPAQARFAAGSRTAVLSVGTTDDAVAEASSVVTAALAPGTGYAVAPDAGSAEVLVEDDDGATWAVAAAPAWLAEGGAATVTVSVTNDWTSAADQTLTLTTTGTASAEDYSLSPTSLTLAAGDASVSATLTATDDATPEGYETVTVSAARGGATVGTATVTITANDGPLAPSARGRIPDRSYPSNELYTKISPQLGAGQHNQPTVINGHLLLAGNGVHEFWDISDPYAPVKVSEFSSPHRFGEAESHQVSYARFGNGSLHLATVSGRGIDLWGIDNVNAPRLLSAVELPNINYGDVNNAVWGIAWQGDYIYVGATTSGLYIVDAADPAQPRLVDTVPRSELGGVAAGPLFALGNLLVVTTPKTHAGVVTMDISDPADPVLLDFVKPPRASYIGAFYGRNAHLQRPFRTYDVTADPRDIREIGSDTTPASEYMSFGDGHLFLGGLRGSSAGIWKYDIADPDDLRLIGRIPGRDRRWDDQFSIPIGNLIAISDDQNVDGYLGSYIAVHDTEPDTRPPVVDYVNPPDGAVDQALVSRIGLSFSDQIELASVDPSTLVVRPVGGQALTGKWGHTQTVVTFWPDRPLEADTDYEIVAAAGGITDLVGNALENEFRSVFRTGAASTRGTGGGIDTPVAVQTGRDADFAADPTPGAREYRWDFGDGHQASGSSVSHSYDTPGRFTVTLSVLAADGRDEFEAEDTTLSGGVAAASDDRFYFGTGYAKYPDATGSNVKIQWRIQRAGAGAAGIDLRYANGGDSERSLELVVNGNTIQTLVFKRTGGWSKWRLATIDDVALDAGANTVELIARSGIGPTIDRLSLPSETSTVVASYSATQIVHRPLTANEPTRSGSVVVTADGARAWAVNPDADSVSAVDTGSLEKAFEAAVGRTPRTLAQAPDGTIWVVNERSHDISVLDSGDGTVIDTIGLPYASMPYGVAFAPDGSAAYVTLQALGRLLRIDPATRTVVHNLALGPDADGIVPKVRGIAIDGDSSRILVARFVSPDEGGEIYDVEVLDQATSLAGTVALRIDPGPDTPDSGRGLPNYIGALAISPDGVHARVPSKKDNIERGSVRDGQALTHESTVRTVVSQIDLSSGHEDLGARVDLNDHDMASALAFSPLGDLLFAVIQGSNTVSVIDAYSGAGVAGMATGRAPQGLALNDQGRLYVQNFMGRSLSVFDVAALLKGMESSARLLAEIDLVADETLSDDVLLGKRIFYDASSSRMSLDGYLSCASCHLDGGQDGRTWDFTDRGEGLRNTISLEGRGGTLLHGPVHWTGNFDEIQDFEGEIRSHFGGSGFMSDDDFAGGTRSDPLGDPKAGLSTELDALAAYVSSLPGVPPSPYRNADGSLTAEGEIGRQVFASNGCGDCHGGAQFTDSAVDVLHDIGTISSASGSRLGESLTGLDTSTLKGVWATAPYLHDGSASTLGEAIEAHSDVSLSGSALGALVSYLQQIDEFAGADGEAATWEVAVAPSEIEEADTATVTVSIANGVTFAADQVVTLTASGTATADDYTLGATTLTLPAGADAVSTTLTASEDEVEEADETVTVSAAHAGSTVGTATVTITDDASSTDASLRGLALSGLDVGIFDPATTEYAVAAPEQVAETTVTATPNDADATVVIADADGTTSGTTRDVALGYGANTITATVTAADGETTQTYTATVIRAYTLPTATIAARTSPVTEGADASFTVRLDKAANKALTVAVTVVETGGMLSGTASSVAIAAGETAATLNLGTVDDSVVEDASSVTVALDTGDGYTVGTTDSAEVSVADNDTATFAVVASPGGIDEGDAATVTVSIANGVTFAADQAVTLTASGTVAADDYTLSPTSLTLAAGDASVSATLTATDDEVEEPAETVTVSASYGGSTVGSATVTIAAGDAPMSDDATLSALTLSDTDIGTFDPATGDYTAEVGHEVAATTVTATPTDADASVTIADGDGTTSGTRRDVALGYGANTISATVTAADGEMTAIYTVTVTRPRSPLTASVHGVPERHDGVGDVEFELRFSEEIALSYRTLRAGYAVEGGTLRWTRRIEPPDNVRWRVAVKPAGDGEVSALLPGNQTCGAAGAVCAADGRMLSNSPVARIPGPVTVPVVSIVADGTPVTEGRAAAFTLTRTGDATEALTVPVSVAESGAMASGALPAAATFAVDAWSATLSVATADDAVVEASSTVTAALTAGTGYAVAAERGAAEILVVDNDTASFAVAASPSEIEEGDAATVTVSIANGVTFAADQAVTLRTSGTAAAEDYTLSATTLTLTAGEAAVSATLTATDDEAEESAETVTLTASHDDKEIGTATVTIGANEPPAVTGASSVDYAENGDEAVAAYTATDPEGETIAWSLSGADDGVFSMTAGELAFLAPPNYENPADANGDNEYRVSVTATDTSGASASVEVTVRVTDVTDPNIVLVLADEGGYELFGAYGSTQYRTPRLDGLSDVGVRFAHAYSKPGSTPSRVALMTGKSNVRNYVDARTLRPGEYTIADLFGDAGYATAIAGKWQLQGKPNQVAGVAADASGFDTYCLWHSDASNRRYWEPTFECDEKLVRYGASDYGPDKLVDFLHGFIETNRDRPFFAYYSMLLPHTPFHGPPDTQCAAADDQCALEKMIAHLDRNVGRVYDKLDDLGLLDNTVFVFTSDNGTHDAIVSQLDGATIRGDKGMPTGGGTRMPLIVRAPGVSGGRVVDDLIDITDLLPTLAEAAGLTIPADIAVDGVSFWDRLQGGSGDPREWIYTYYFPEPYAAVDGRRTPRNHPEAAYAHNKGHKLYASGDLYDLAADPHEVRPMADGDEESAGTRAALQAALDSMPVRGQAIRWSHVTPDARVLHPRPRWRPVLKSASVNAATLSLEYAGLLDTGRNPGAEAFSVEVDGTGRTVTAVSLTEAAVTLTLASAVTAGETVTVSYAAPQSQPLRSKSGRKGNVAADLTDMTVLNGTTASTGPTVESIASGAQHPTKDPFAVTITFSESVTGLTQSELEVANGAASDLAGSGSTRTLTVTPDADFDGDVTVTVPPGVAEDSALNTNEAGSETFAVDTLAPALAASDAATVNGATLTLTFNEALGAANVASSAFTVTGAATRSISGVAVSGSTVQLTLSVPVLHGETGVEVDYDRPSGEPVVDAVGNPAAMIVDRAVTNRTSETTLSTAIRLAMNEVAVAEGGPAKTVTVTGMLNRAPRPSATPVTIQVGSDADTAAEGRDYANVDDVALTIPAYATNATASFTLTPTNDRIDEPRERLAVTGSTTVAGLTVTPSGGLAIDIEDDDLAPALELDVSSSTIDEDGGTATVTASTGSGSTFAADQTVRLAVAGTATETADYTISGKTLTLAAGDDSVSATLTAIDDEAEEPDETVTVTAVHDGREIGTATVTIPANDAPSTDVDLKSLALSGLDIGTFDPATTAYAATAAESVAQTTVTAAPNDDGASVAIADADGSTAGTTRDVALDYGENTITATVTAADGETTKAYTVTVTRAYTPPAATIAAGTSPVSEGTDAVFRVSLDKAAKDTLTVAVSVSETGRALSGTASSVAIDAGDTAATLTVATEDDAVVEQASTVTVALVAGDGYTLGAAASAAVVVEDGDAATWKVAAGKVRIEEAGDTAVTVSIANGVTFAADQAVTLTATGTAAAGDYTLSPTSLTLAAGDQVASATLTATDDEAEESDETVTVSASHGGNEIGTATVTIAANDAPLSDDATLAALTLSDIDIGTFEASTTAYSAEVDNAVESTTVTATPNDADASVTISDPDGSTAGTTRTTRLAEGANAIGAAVTAADGETTATYTVAVTRAAADTVTWGERLPGKDIDLSAADRPRGLGSDGETLWAADWDTSGVVAYALADGARREARDFGLDAFLVTALYTDGETLWAADYEGGVYAYRLSDGERLEAGDLDAETMAEAGNGRPAGLWSDGATMWVADQSDRHVYAYRLSDGARESGKEFALVVGDVEYMTPFGLWSDGATVLTTDWLQGTVRAYALAGGARRSGNDVGADATANDYAAGLWSDGETLWVVDEVERKAYAYAAPGLRKPPAKPEGVVSDLSSRALVVPSGMAAGPPVSIPDAGLRGRIGAALGKAAADAVGVNEVAALVVLDARDAGVTDLTGIEHAVNLEGLDLGHNPLTDLRPLSSLTALRRLNLDGTGADPWELAALHGLKELSLRSSALADVWPLRSMNGLEVLDLAGNRIDDLAALAALANLRVLDVSGNRVAELSPLAGLDRLRELHVGGNPIEDFAPLAERAGLRVFGVGDQDRSD